MDALAASPFAVLDAHSSLRLVTDAVHEDDALCLALTCRALRDALWARFPARPAGHPHAGKRLRTRDAAVAKLGAAVNTAGLLEIHNASMNSDSDYGDEAEAAWRRLHDEVAAWRRLQGMAPQSHAVHGGCGWLRSLPEGIGRLAYLPRPGLRTLDLRGNPRLAALPAALGRLGSLEVLNIDRCPGLALEPAINGEGGLPALLAYLRDEAVEGVAELDLSHCGLTALPEGVGGLTGLKRLVLSLNAGLTALPEGLWSLAGLEELDLSGCGLTALPEGIGRLAGLKKLDLSQNSLGLCGLRALPEGIGALAGLRKLNLWFNKELTALPAGLGRLRNLEELNLRYCPRLAALEGLQEREGLPALLAHLAVQGEAAPAPGVEPS
jgi:hypothetical protein